MRPWNFVDDQTLQEIATLRDDIQRFGEGRLTADELRPRRTLYGVYGQRHKDRYMLRVKVPQGVLEAPQLEALGRVAAEYSRGFGYVTTRQDIQFHFLLLEHAVPALELLASAGLTTREAGGNIVRNVTCDPFAGICRDDVFDVTAYSHAVSRHFLRNPNAQSLPRKIKIAFSGCPHDHALTWIHDIGAQAVVRDGRRGFRMVVGGGLGTVPHLAQTLEEFVPDDELVRTCDAVVRVFDRVGDRKKRVRARLKFVVMRRGIEEFRELVRQELASMPPASSGAYATPDLTLEEAPPAYPAAAAAERQADGFELWRTVNVVPQKQPACYAVQVALPAGAVTAEQFAALARIVRRFSSGPLRTTIEQNLLLRWVRGGNLVALHRALIDGGLAHPTAETLLDPVACPGTETCMSAITSGKGLARAIVAEFSQDGYLADPLARAARIKVSGCPNSCGQHYAGDIGLYGSAMHVDGRLIPAYQLLVGGGDGGALAEPVMRLAAKRVPQALRALVDHYRRVRTPGEPLRDYLRRVGPDGVREALAPYAHLPSFVEDPAAYVDWETDKLFSLDERGEGECSV
jgi:sulfite reductase (ferredoxin)